MAKGRKISIVGAGAVGTAVAYAALIRQVANEIALYDINTTKVEAEAADLAHGSHFTGWPYVNGSSDIAVTNASDIVVITAGAKQNPGQSRLELVKDNARILKAMMPKLVDASPEAIFILVTNPCDVLTMVAQRISGLPSGRVISSGTVLDSSRLRRLIADRARVSTASVHASIIGEHGDSEFAMWSVARIGAVPIADYRVEGHQVFPPEVLDDLAHQVMTSAYKVIAGKGATNFAIGLSASRICEAILRNEHSVQPVSSILHGQYGIHDVALSLPSVLGSNGVEQILDTPLSDDEKSKLRNSAEAIMNSFRLVEKDL
ncbi:MAG: L-lactate dehydrogenase [Lautropia sp.]|nr:L-lactate dehydrogenase [Lautropia sp.]